MSVITNQTHTKHIKLHDLLGEYETTKDYKQNYQ